jgi:predicted NAD/FAD-dependent oxidoreductase
MNFVCSIWHLGSVNEIHGWVSSTNHHLLSRHPLIADCELPIANCGNLPIRNRQSEIGNLL